jgi:hypothetical protein
MLFYALHAVACNGISFMLVYLKISAQWITANHSTILCHCHLSIQTTNLIRCLWRHILILSLFLKAFNFLDILTPNFYISFLCALSDLHLICDCSYYSSTRWCVFILKFLIKQYPTLQSDSFPPFQVKIFLAFFFLMFVHTVYPLLHQEFV